MNLNLFDNVEGTVLRERENGFRYPTKQTACSKENGAAPRFPEHTPIAMAYVPYQQWGETFLPDEALANGTLFKELVFPFMEGGRR